MKIYLSGAIRGGRQLQKTYEVILDFLQKKNHEVLTFHVASPNILETENSLSEVDIFTQDETWLKECDCVVAEVSVPSLGVGYEIAYALCTDKPVMAVFNSNFEAISAMVAGNTSPLLTVTKYHSHTQLIHQIDTFLDKIDK
ncbi:MAG: nucleoside 2-deoxyribosyltransferase [Candidatus Hodarchaeales archaeon]|jgi:nucleoside 2-deoxyribosyltransferase